MRKLPLAVVLTVGLASTTSCSDETEQTAPVEPPAATSASETTGALLTASVPNESGEAMAALISGRLDLDSEGCVVLNGRSGVGRVVWPFGWTAQVDDSEVTVRTPSGDRFAVTGDLVSGGGGFVPLESVGGVLDTDSGARCFPDSADEVPVLQVPNLG